MALLRPFGASTAEFKLQHIKHILPTFLTLHSLKQNLASPAEIATFDCCSLAGRLDVR